MPTDKATIETERLLIRRFCAADWADLHEYLSDPDIVKFEPYGIFTIGQCRQEARRRADDRDFWAVCLSESGKLVGNIYLAKQKFDTWELGYVFNKMYQGLGYASESAGALLDDTFLSQDARRITAMCNRENNRSWRLLERLGFVREGCLRQNAYFKKDEKGHPLWFDTYMYGMLRPDWLAAYTGKGRSRTEAQK